MNKFVIYIFIVLIYLGLSKNFSPSEYGVAYIQNFEQLSAHIPGAPVTAILTDYHTSGFLIKTHYLKLKIVKGFESVDELILRTPSDFAEQNIRYIGLSIFRRFERDQIEDTTPLPPGSIFLNDREFGVWRNGPSGDKEWRFYRAYRNLPLYLGWGKYRPSYQFHEKAQVHIGQHKPFFGLYDNFGPEGELTRKNFPAYFQRKPKQTNFKKFILDYFKENFYND